MTPGKASEDRHLSKIGAKVRAKERFSQREAPSNTTTDYWKLRPCKRSKLNWPVAGSTCVLAEKRYYVITDWVQTLRNQIKI